MNLYEKSLKTLELPQVLDLLEHEAVSEEAKRKVREIVPSANADEVHRRLTETTAAKNMMAVKGSPSFSGVKDVRGFVGRADMGGMLNPRELLDIAACSARNECVALLRRRYTGQIGHRPSVLGAAAQQVSGRQNLQFHRQRG